MQGEVCCYLQDTLHPSDLSNMHACMHLSRLFSVSFFCGHAGERSTGAISRSPLAVRDGGRASRMAEAGCYRAAAAATHQVILTGSAARLGHADARSEVTGMRSGDQL